MAETGKRKQVLCCVSLWFGVSFQFFLVAPRRNATRNSQAISRGALWPHHEPPQPTRTQPPRSRATTCCALNYFKWHNIALHCLHHIAFHRTTLHYITLPCITSHYITVQFTALLHHILLHCMNHIALHYVTSHHIASHYITLR